ncbi:uncharacterized protein JCM10292_001726 [Rhodotorula paludigena]|uniref:uncharacterized protein n=1 Tax=Rhodotorula paludigena TaxID=86838 RepID=UPI00316C4519
MSTELRARRPFKADLDDGDEAFVHEEILSPPEQDQVVQELLEQAQSAQKQYLRAGLALQLVVLLLLAIFPLPRALAPPFLARLAALSLLVSLARLTHSLRQGTPLLAYDLVPLLPCALLAALVSLAPSARAGEGNVRLLWTVGPLGAQGLGLLLEFEGRRGVQQVQELRELMYDAPEA